MELLGLITMGHWAYAILGVSLLILEILVPAFFFIWFAVAAFAVAALTYVYPGLATEMQFLLFAITGLSAAILFAKRSAAGQKGDEASTLNRRGEQHVGEVHRLAQAIENGEGKIKLGDSLWKVRGPDCEAGTQVEITGVSSIVFTVKPVAA